MKPQTIDRALVEALRFVKMARAYRADRKANPARGSATKQSAAVRRASMDLTRALADLRQGR